MKSIVWKCGIITIIIILLHCVNDPPSIVHLLLNLEVEELNDTTSQVIITTPVPENYSYYRVVDDSCTLIVSYRKLINNSIDSTFIETHKIANDSTASQLGTFQGVWVFGDSLSFDSLYPNTPIFFDGCVLDEKGHNICASYIFYEDTTLPEIRCQAY